MDDRAQAYAQANYPPHGSWWFHKGQETPAQRELRALHLIELKGTKGGAWSLTAEGHRWVMQHQLSDEIRWARALFSVFEQAYAKQISGQWSFRTLDDLEAGEVGLDLHQTRVAVKILRQKRLIEADASGEGTLKLTEIGEETCLHPETIDARLGPQGVSNLVDASTTNVVFNAPAQVGDGNIQNVTYTMVLQQLVKRIEKDPNVTPEQKTRWGDAIKDIIAKGLGEAVVSGIGTLLG